MEPISNFTPRAEQAMALARTEAERLHHKSVGAEHVLLGLLAMGQGTATHVLLHRGMNLEAVRGEVGRQVGPSPSQKIIGAIPYSPEVKKILARAAEEAQALRHTYIGLEHVLLALLANPGEVVARVFKHFAVEPEFPRQELLRELGPNIHSGSAAALAKTPTPGPAPKPPNSTPPSQPAKLSLPAKPQQTTKASLPSPAPQPGKAPPAMNSTRPVQAPGAAAAPKTPGFPAPPGSRESVDINRPYDIHCSDASQGVVVHKNVRFRSVKQLLPLAQNDPLAVYFELEFENGQTVFVPRSSVIRFEERVPGVGK